MLSNWSLLVGRGTDFFLHLSLNLTRWRGRSVQIGEHEVYGWENLNQCLQVRYHHLEQDEHISCPLPIHPFLERYHCFHSVTSGIRAAKLHPSQSPLLLFWEREPSQVIAIRSNIHWTLSRPPGRFPQSSWHCHQLWQSRGLLLFFQIHNMFQRALIVNLFRKQVADQMSGNVYMHASVVEDECSKVSERWILKHLSIMWNFSAFVWWKR